MRTNVYQGFNISRINSLNTSFKSDHHLQLKLTLRTKHHLIHTYEIGPLFISVQSLHPNRCLKIISNLKSKASACFDKSSRELQIHVFITFCVKNFERIGFDQLHGYFTTNGLLFASEGGFRKRLSTELAALELTDKIRREINQKKTPFSVCSAQLG